MSHTVPQSLPATCRALVCTQLGQPLSVQTVPTPDAIPGSVVVRVLVSAVEPGTLALLRGERSGATFPLPMVPGGRAIGRVAAIGSDTTTLQIGELVSMDPFIRGRDDPNVQILQGLGMFGSDPRSKKLIAESWRDGMFVEYVRTPLENCHALNEKLLLGSPAEGGLGYSVAELCFLTKSVVAYGGFCGINLKAGETVIVAPATGGHSGSAVQIASALGARVIAVGRDLAKLQAIAAVNPRVNTVQLKGNFEEDLASLKQFGPIDAYLDLSPAVANESTHVQSCLMAVKQYGRVSLMGVIRKDIAIPYVMAVLNNLTIRGQYMYERKDVRGLIRLVETGVVKLGKSAGHEVVGQFQLEDWKEAMELSDQKNGAGRSVVFTP